LPNCLPNFCLKFSFWGKIPPGDNCRYYERVPGEAIFSNLDLIFAIGIAYGLANDGDGASALSAGIGVLIAKSAYLQIDKDLNTGVFIGIIIGVVAGYIYNRFHTIKLPQFLGFFGGKRFVPILTSLVAIVIGILIGNFWHYVESGIEGGFPK